MTERTKDFVTFAVLLAASAALAIGGLLWLGPEGRLPVEMAADGTVTRSTGVLALTFGPAFTLVLWGLGAPAAMWLSSALTKLRASDPSGDAVQGLTRYLGALRAYVTGFTLLVIFIQIFMLLRAAGVARPLGLDRESVVRLFSALGGLLFIFIGNVSPKIPYVPNRWMDAARHFKGNRFAGWVFLVGGIAYVTVALGAPFDRLPLASFSLCLSMMILTFGRYVALTLESLREARAGGR
jgi:hypothetical protein